MAADQNSELLLMPPKDYFGQVVEAAFLERKIETFPQIKSYVVDLLTHFMFTDNLWAEEDASGKKQSKMLAEILLSATQSEPRAKIKKLKQLGDHSLYVSGFFSDSLQRKIIDVDYYVDMGRTAYDTLAGTVDEDTFSALYREMAQKFLVIVDVLTIISNKTRLTDDQNLLRLIDVYSKTGSEHLGETLVAKGFFNLSEKDTFGKKQ